ncbi:MAG: type III-B CRISPR module RAMP protein Cmr4 [Firmicutes bacterium]|nr:type III-B CRISPR module RAMP protein Cmr4 [Bacillota bacterium]
MKAGLIGLLNETSMHPGAESSTGVVDLPVAREVNTNYPVLVGSSLKGALRESVEERVGEKWANEIFGAQNQIGNVAITDGRLLLLPVRTLIGHYKWVTCPYILERYFRDLKLTGHEIKSIGKIAIKDEEHAMFRASDEELFLEEIIFTRQGDEVLEKVAEKIKPLIFHQSLRDRLLEQLVLVSDDVFSYYARYGLEVRARNRLESETKTSAGLWYEECLPADTLFYSMLLPRTGREDSLANLMEVFAEKPYIQIGGNETIGQGWCVLSRWGDDEK